MGAFEQVSAKGIQDELDANIYHVTMLSKLLLTTLESRNSRSAIMNVSSVAATSVIPNATSYSATKACVSYFTMALQQEIKNTDVMLLTPGYVRTPMIGNYNPPLTCTADECAQAALADLSLFEVSAGAFKSKITKVAMELCSRNLPGMIWNVCCSFTAA